MNQEAETQKAKGVEPKAETTMGQPVNAEENTNSGGPPPWVHLYNIALCVAAFVIGGISVSRDYEPTQVGATLLGFGGVVLVRYLNLPHLSFRRWGRLRRRTGKCGPREW